MANSLLNIMVIKNLIKRSNCEEDSEEMCQEGNPNGVNYDYMSKHLLMSMKHMLTVSPLKDTSTEIE